MQLTPIKLVPWTTALITAIGCLFFIRDNIIFLLWIYPGWQPDQELNLLASIGMLTGSAVTVYNLIWWVILWVHTIPCSGKVKPKPLIPLMKPVLAISGALSLIYALSLSGAVLTSLQVSFPRPYPAILLFIVFIVSLVWTVFSLWRMAFSRMKPLTLDSHRDPEASFPGHLHSGRTGT